jgi:hypothetical protein
MYVYNYPFNNKSWNISNVLYSVPVLINSWYASKKLVGGKEFKIFARYIYSSASLGRSLPPKYISLMHWDNKLLLIRPPRQTPPFYKAIFSLQKELHYKKGQLKFRKYYSQDGFESIVPLGLNINKCYAIHLLAISQKD